MADEVEFYKGVNAENKKIRRVISIFAGRSLRIGRGLCVLLVLGLVVGVMVGCTSIFNKNIANPEGLSPKRSSSALSNAVQPLGTAAASCVSAVMEPERGQILQQALADSQLQAVRGLLENRGLTMNANEAMVWRVADANLVFIPFGQQTQLVWSLDQKETSAVGMVQQNNKTLNILSNGQEHSIRALNTKQVQDLLKQLRNQAKFKEFEKQLNQKGKRLADEHVHVMVNETRGIAAIGLATDDSPEGHFTHQVRVKIGRNDVLENESTLETEEIGCSSAVAQSMSSQTSVGRGVRVKPTVIDGGGGGTIDGPPIIDYNPPLGNGSDSRLCVSSWGYPYLCVNPAANLQISSSAIQATSVVGYYNANTSVTVWNGSGATLQVTATLNPGVPNLISGPFSFISQTGNLITYSNSLSFSLAPGQPQELTVHFSPSAVGTVQSALLLTGLGQYGDTTQAPVAITGNAYSIDDFCNAQMTAYNAAVNAGGTPVALLNDRLVNALRGSGDPNATTSTSPSTPVLLFGLRNLTCDQIKQILPVLDQIGIGPGPVPPIPVAPGDHPYDPSKVLAFLNYLVGLGSNTIADEILKEYGKQADFYYFVTDLRQNLFSGGSESAFTAILRAMLQDIFLAQLPASATIFAGTIIEVITQAYNYLYPSVNEADQQNYTERFLVFFVQLEQKFPQLQSGIQQTFLYGNQSDQISGILAATMSLTSLSDNILTTLMAGIFPPTDPLAIYNLQQAIFNWTNAFTTAFSLGLYYYYNGDAATKQAWAQYVLTFIYAIAGNNSVVPPTPEQRANMAAGLISLVRFGEAG